MEQNKIKEAYRILKKNGLLFLLFSGKNDWKGVIKTFGFEGNKGFENKLKLIKKFGFKILKSKKSSSKVYYKDMESFYKTLEIIPFKPQFNRKKHIKELKEYVKKYKKRWGIEVYHERVLAICKK